MKSFLRYYRELEERALEISPEAVHAEKKAIKQILKALDALGKRRIAFRGFEMNNERSPIDLVSNTRRGMPFGVHGISPKFDKLFAEVFSELKVKRPVFFTNDPHNQFLGAFGTVSIFVPIGEGDYYYSQKIGDIGRYVRVAIGHYSDLHDLGLRDLDDVKDKMFDDEWFKKMKKEIIKNYSKSKKMPDMVLDEIMWTGKRYWLIRVQQTSFIDNERIISDDLIYMLKTGKKVTYADVAADIRATTGIDYK